jgi:pyrimidine-specific ribonucleoside hydrolase
LIAILYLLQRPDIDIKAITVSAGRPLSRAREMPNPLRYGSSEIPVACGRDTPLAGSRTFPEAWRSPIDELYGVSLPENPNPPSDQPAVGLLSAVLQNSIEPVSILALGPLTNLAEMLQADPTLPAQISSIVIMGGALNVPGNMFEDEAAQNPIAEWNIYVDPYAAQIVLASGVPITLPRGNERRL